MNKSNKLLIGNCSGSAEAISERDIAKDVTISISQIGEYKSNGKVKWVDFSSAVKQAGDEVHQYQVCSVFIIGK